MYQSSEYAESGYWILDIGKQQQDITEQKYLRRSDARKRGTETETATWTGTGRGVEMEEGRGGGEREKVIESTRACLRRDYALKLLTRWR